MSFGYVTKSVVSLVKSKRTELTGLCDLLALGSSAWYDAIMPYFFENYISLKNVKKNTDKMTHKHIFFLRQTCTTITNYENSVVNWIVKARLFAILVWSGKNILIFYKKKKLVKLNNVYFQKIQFDQRVNNILDIWNFKSINNDVKTI